MGKKDRCHDEDAFEESYTVSGEVARCVISAGTALFAMQHTPERTIMVAAGIPLSIAVLSIHSAWEERHYK